MFIDGIMIRLRSALKLLINYNQKYVVLIICQELDEDKLFHVILMSTL